jgi:deazaflavin-dependent oxidoreductase (nitroreductase family)
MPGVILPMLMRPLHNGKSKGVPMPTPNDALKDHLSRYREINLSVTGRKSGRTISQPVWFVYDDDKVYLLPVRGSDTQWYKNVLKNPSIRIDARGADAEFQAVAITDHARVSSVVEKFRTKYGASDVKKYYSKFDVAVVAQMR